MNLSSNSNNQPVPLYKTVNTENLWSEAEDAALKRLYPDHTVNEISQIIGRTYSAVEGRAWHLRLFKFTHWTQEGIQKLKELYPNFSARQVAEKIGCSLNAVQHKVRQLGLCTKRRKTKEDRCLVFKLVSNDYQRRSERHVVAASVFDKSQVSNAAVAVM